MQFLENLCHKVLRNPETISLAKKIDHSSTMTQPVPSTQPDSQPIPKETTQLGCEVKAVQKLNL